LDSLPGYLWGNDEFLDDFPLVSVVTVFFHWAEPSILDESLCRVDHELTIARPWTKETELFQTNSRFVLAMQPIQ
jgi:hypothetical protein